MKKLKKIPEFNSEKEERKFWLKNDSSDYLDWNKAEFVNFVNLKPSTKNISIRMPDHLLNRIKVLANKADVPYQSYLKIMLADRVSDEERKKKTISSASSS